MGFSIAYFTECLQSGIVYLPRTIELAGGSVVIGLVFGTVLAILRVYRIPFLGKLAGLLVTLYQGVPVVVALMIFNLIFVAEFDTVSAGLHLNSTVADVDTLWLGIFVLSLRAVCQMEESIRGAFYSVDHGQYEAGLSVGMTQLQVLRRIVLPQLLPAAVPPLMNNVVGTIKNSSIVIAVGIAEVLTGATIPCSRTYSFLEGYVAAAVIYWAFTAVVEQMAVWLERYSSRYRRQSV